MPTKQVMSLVSARAAVTLIISEEVNSIVISSLSFLESVLFQPGLEQLTIPSDSVPLLVEGVVALVVAQGVGRGCALFRDGDGGDGPGRNHAGVYRGAEVIDDFLNGDDAALGGQHGLFLYADDAFYQHVAFAVCALGMDHGHIRAY